MRRDQVLVQIFVRDNNVEQALRALKKKMQREGTFREMKRRKFYEKPSEKRARQKAEAVRRARKLIRAERSLRQGIDPGKPGVAEKVEGFARLRAGYYRRLQDEPQAVAELRERVPVFGRMSDIV